MISWKEYYVLFSNIFNKKKSINCVGHTQNKVEYTDEIKMFHFLLAFVA